VHPLTKRELAVARLAATGMTTGEMGSHFYVDQRRIEFILDQVYNKTGAARRSDLATWLRDRGLIAGAGKPAAEGNTSDESNKRPGIPAQGRDLDLEDRLAGGVWGHLVGDAMGVPYEFQPPPPLREIRWGHQAGHHRQPPGTWSDDGGLMLALLDSLVQGTFDTADQGRRALEWWRGDGYKPGPIFDIGLITQSSLERIRTGTVPEEAGAFGERDNGNGSLMRILPVALVDREATDAELVTQAMRASSLTHRHPRSMVTCAVYVLAARSLLRGAEDRTRVLQEAFAAVASAVGKAEVGELRVLQTFTGRTGSGYVVDSFWSAWDAFAGGNSYRQVVERAIAYGDDTDTTSCVAGGLAGIYWGRSGIPNAWLKGIRGRDVAEPILRKLLATAGGSAHAR
jgi:ADP-ribosyl-[dinitrogen reductase] hydrolase